MRKKRLRHYELRIFNFGLAQQLYSMRLRFTMGRLSLLPVILCLLSSVLSSCQPKADYETIENPMTGFSLSKYDSVRGAASVQELSCYFYSTLNGDITFDELSRHIPDSADIAAIYAATNTPTAGVPLRENADSVLSRLHRGFNDALSKASVLHADWSNAAYEQLMVIEIEGQRLPSKKMVIICSDGKTKLRASAKCLQIGDRWFIGEDIRYGI